MVKVIMHGCNGHMGQVITDLIAKDENAQIVAGIDMVDSRDNRYPVFTDIKACQVEADVMIDFSSFKATLLCGKTIATGTVYHRSDRRTVGQDEGMQQKGGNSEVCQYVSGY